MAITEIVARLNPEFRSWLAHRFLLIRVYAGCGSAAFSGCPKSVGTRLTRVIPDLDNELCHALAQVEELLLTLAAWEDDPDAPATLPVPVAGRVALEALNRVQDAVIPTQSRHDRPVPTGGRLLGPDGHYEHRPLRLVTLDPADLTVLAATAELLGRTLATHPHSELVDAIAAGAEAAAPTCGPAPTPVELVEVLARALGLVVMCVL
jgi:hypothetical protein